LVRRIQVHERDGVTYAIPRLYWCSASLGLAA
jgi:hypothetical protein